MKHFHVLALLTALIICIAPASAAATLYVDTSGACGGNTPCYMHPQDAVNNANPGDTIKVYPGTYEQRKYTFPKGPFDWGDGDRYAPALIVWKDGLTIEAADPSAAPPVIQTTYGTFWVNKVPVYASTGGTYTCTVRTSTAYPPVPWTCTNDCTTPACPWTCKDANGAVIDQAPLAGKYVCSAGSWSGTYVQPSDGIAPIAVSIIADGVTVRGLSIGSAVSDYAALLIGEVGVGNLQYLGADGNTIENNIFPDVKQAVFIWHSSNNRILNNRIEQASWDCSIQQYDGYTNAQAGTLPQSANNRISGNTILDDSGICLGAWGPSGGGFNTVVDIDGSTVCCNTLGPNGFVKFEFADGPALSGCNDPSTLILNPDQSGNPTTSKILQIDGVTYTGPAMVPLPPSDLAVPIVLTATVQYQGSIDVDGSGIPVEFTIDGKTYSVMTVAGGTATATTDPLPPGHYVVKTKVAVCDGCCVVADEDPLDIVKTILIVKKILVLDNGGTKSASDFSFSINSGDEVPFEAGGENDIAVLPNTPYTVTEIPDTGYTTTYTNCENVVIPDGETATCEITNDDKPGNLIVKKIVVNDNGGTQPVTAFSFIVNGGEAVAFETDGVNELTVDAGSYIVTEPAVTGYSTSYQNCDPAAVPNGGTATCEITNDDKPGTLTVQKKVINDNGRSLTAKDFKFAINGGTAQPFEADGQNEVSVNAGTYTVREPAVTGYTTTYSPSCTNVVIPIGGAATCIITNNDQACPTKPCAKLTACPTCGTKPLKVKFTDSSTGISPGGSWKLDFGDGSPPVTIRDPSNVYYHTYLTAGTYYAKLTVKNACGQGTTSTVTITVKCPTMSASMTVTKVSTYQVKVQVTSTGWDSGTLNWGDGTSTPVSPPNTKYYYHTYANRGTYTIRLTIRNECSTTGVSTSRSVTI